MLVGEIAFALSPSVVIEYEDVLLRPDILGPAPWITPGQVGTLLDTLCKLCVPAFPQFRFRPLLRDPKDDLYVECAITAGAELVVSDDRHFRDPILKDFGLDVRTAVEFEGDWQKRRVPT